MSMENIIDLARYDNPLSLSRSSSVPSSQVAHNSVYFSTNCNHLSAKFVWNINGTILEIYSFDHKCNNRLIGMFDFGQIYNDQSIAISYVTRLVDRFEVTSKFRHPYKLIVILSLSNDKSYVCIVDVRLNSVINTIEFPFNITCAEVILSGTPTNADKWPLVRELICMNGILAVGCDGGLVFFIDLILDSYSPIPLIPKQISTFTCNSAHIDLQNKRRTAIFHNQVICIPLNTDAKNKGKFNYRANDGTILASFPAHHIYVTALNFVPQLAMVCVGYNFGGFHLYNLNSFKLDCSCGVESDLLPVVSFAFQAPENDPKNYSYLWIVRGFCKTPNLEETPQKSCSTAFLYLLCYENKEYINTYGILFTKFKLCVCKFEFPLTVNPYDKNSHLHSSSKLLDMFTIHQVSSLKINDDEVSPIDYNLFFVAWQAQTENEKRNVYFFLFDLNQWYKTQMPKCFCVDDENLCPFVSIYSMNSLAKSFSPESIQAIYFHNNSLSKFCSNLFYLDIHSYPASLSFNVTVASQSKMCNVFYQGFQKQLLSQFRKIGPNFLVDPEDIVTKCFQYGLISPDYFNIVNDPSNEIVTKRELLLNIALENSLIPFLINTIKEWSSGELTNLGCDLKHILDWTWKKVIHIKSSIDALTKPLFDFSGCNISQQDIAKLMSHETDLASLSVLLKQLPVHATVLTKQGLEQLMARSEIVQLIRSYLKIILLFEEFNLLPERDVNNQIGETVTYPFENLSRFYAKRRKDFISIQPMLFKNKDVLLIDTIVRQLNSQKSLWQHKPDSDKFQCLYPPPNLHSLIRIFLVDSVPRIYKESILIYFLFDLSQSSVEHQLFIGQKIEYFISSLSINPGIRYFIRGLWCLDHQNYDSALKCLTHPIVISSLSSFKIDITMFNELMQRIVELFLFKNEFKSALIFTQCNSHFLIDSEQNESLYIQMLILNNNLTGAIEFQRQRRSISNSYQILWRLFFVSEKNNCLVNICRIPLDDFEENVFTEFLLASVHPKAKQILILYFILNNKLLDAFNIVKEFEHELDLSQEQNKRIVDLAEAYSSRIPLCLVSLADEITTILTKNCESDANSLIMTKSTDQTTLKINPKQRNIKKISSALSIEKVLEMNESQFKPQMNSIQSPTRNDRRRSVYLSPSVSRMQFKAKKQNGIKDLFTVLKTPDVIRKMDISSHLEPFSDSPKKPSILKHYVNDDSESDRHSTMSDNSKLKVSFSISKSKVDSRNNYKADCPLTTSIEISCEDNPVPIQVPKTLEEINPDFSEFDDDPDDDSSKPRSRLITKVIDTPTHRMKLRSKKP